MQISGLKALTNELANSYITKLKAENLSGYELELYNQWQRAMMQQNQVNTQLQQLQLSIEQAKNQIAQFQGQIELAISMLIKAEDDRQVELIVKETESKAELDSKSNKSTPKAN